MQVPVSPLGWGTVPAIVAGICYMYTNHKDQKIQHTVKNITHVGQVKIGGKKCIFSDL